MRNDPIERCAEAAREAIEDQCYPPAQIARAVLEEFRNWLLDDQTVNGRRIAAAYIKAALERGPRS